MAAETGAVTPAHYLCFATDQPLVNLTPVAGRCFPIAAATIIAWPARRAHAGWLGDALRALEGEAFPVEIAETQDAYDLTACQTLLDEIAAKHPEGCIANITGGSKLLALAAWEVLRRPTDAICYVDPQHDVLTWLYPQRARTPIPNRLDLSTWLIAFGFEAMPNAPPTRPKARQLKGPADEARRRIEAIAEAYQRGEPGQARKLASGPGRWLETYLAYELAHLFDAAPNLRERLHDASGPFVVRRRDDAKIANEVDAALLFDNRLFLFEVKNGSEAAGGLANDAIYRLGQLRQQLGGWLSAGVFVSARLASDVLRARARAFGVSVIDAPHLPKLRRKIEALLIAPPPA